MIWLRMKCNPARRSYAHWGNLDMPDVHSHGVKVHYEEYGSGRPFLFSHGLGGCINQILPWFRDSTVYG